MTAITARYRYRYIPTCTIRCDHCRYRIVIHDRKTTRIHTTKTHTIHLIEICSRYRYCLPHTRNSRRKTRDRWYKLCHTECGSATAFASIHRQCIIPRYTDRIGRNTCGDLSIRCCYNSNARTTSTRPLYRCRCITKAHTIDRECCRRICRKTCRANARNLRIHTNRKRNQLIAIACIVIPNRELILRRCRKRRCGKIQPHRTAIITRHK